MTNESQVINFAYLLKHDLAKYPKIKEYLDNCREELPFTTYYGGIKKSDVDKLKKAAKYFGLEFFIPENNISDTEYNFIFLKHKIVYGKDFYVHYNPLERVQLSKRVLKSESKSEWNDPKITLDIEDFELKNFIFAPKKIQNNQLPIEMKLSLGILFNDNDEQKLFIEDFINDLQSEISNDDPNFYECEFTRDFEEA